MDCSGCEWDPHKDLENQAKHRVKFEDACCVFTDPNRIVFPDDRDYGEERWIAIGRVTTRTMIVVFTERNGRERIISARRAKRAEERMYYEAIA